MKYVFHVFYWDVRSSDPGPLFILISQHVTTPKSDPFAAVFDVVNLLYRTDVTKEKSMERNPSLKTRLSSVRDNRTFCKESPGK